MSLKYNTQVKLGTIDPTYLGDCGVIFRNDSDMPQYFTKDDAIAQIVFNEVVKFSENNIKYVDEFSETGSKRGENGFGHTGTNKGGV